MKKFKYILFLILFFSFFQKGHTSIIDESVSNIYNDIFSQSVLSEEDVDLYRKIILLNSKGNNQSSLLFPNDWGNKIYCS